tara:strand:+ start:523 stop:1122 length:600 start_codon:yes stop_codon:yes gene_type:complete
MKKRIISNEEDLNLIKLIKNKNCSVSFVSLTDKHSKLFYSICNKFKSKLNIEEVHKDRDFVFYKALVSFKDDRNAKFSTWLGNYTRFHCLNYIKNNSKYVYSEEDTINHFFNTKSMENYEDNSEMKNDVDHAFNILSKLNDKRIFKIFKLRYLNKGERLTWKQIAEKFSLTPQTIINLHTKGRRILKKKMKKNMKINLT